ncbi:putative nuclease HARBI1 [Betta splendens]|uniref:Putative nuclease HARBI1 n=1 Tax=Betta splendens TaxID=158456 RepID=A0A6P7L4Q1_BETSP|nr:putative nuclease HARBI1 [Betta splendens]
MAFALPVWLAVQDELLGRDQRDWATPSCFDAFDDAALFQMFHLTRPCIAFITDLVRIRTKTVPADKPDTTVDAAVMVALNYYAHGVLSPAILQRVGASDAECGAMLRAVSAAVSDMSSQFISFPATADDRAKLASKVEKLCGIPDVLGAMAPAHFMIRASPYEKSAFRSFVNTLGYTSVASQVVCDPDGNILSVDTCCVGSTYAQDMWESSLIGREIERDVHGPYWIVGGTGYHLSKHVLTPVSDPASDIEVRFNKAHAKIHNVVWRTLGTMRRRFRCLMQLGFAREDLLKKQSNIIKTCCVLHNIAKKFSVPPPPVVGKIEPPFPAKQLSAPTQSNPEAMKARQKLIEDNREAVLRVLESLSCNSAEDGV